MTAKNPRPRPSAAALEAAIAANQKALAEHRRAAGRSLTEAQAERIADDLFAKITAPEPAAPAVPVPDPRIDRLHALEHGEAREVAVSAWSAWAAGSGADRSPFFKNFAG